MPTPDEVCDIIEAKIVDLQNENYADPRVQQLLDLEAEIVLQEYYESQEYCDLMFGTTPIEYDNWADDGLDDSIIGSLP